MNPQKKTLCPHPEGSLLSKNVLQNKVILVQIWTVQNKMSVLIGLVLKGQSEEMDFFEKTRFFGCL